MADNKVSVFVTVIIEQEGAFALVREGKLADDGHIYNLPSGKIEVGETIEDAALREAAEETGLRVEQVRLQRIYQRPLADNGRNMINIVYVATQWSGEFSASNDHPEVRWCTEAEIARLHENGQLRVAYIPKILGDYHTGRRLPPRTFSTVPY